MACEFGPDTEFLFRPYPYGRDPFKLADDELVAYEARFFSLIYFALINDIRLFTEEGSHPVASPFKLYINKNTGLFTSAEPTLAASGFETATPHYAEVITDARAALDDVFDVHAADSDHVANAFRLNHFKRQRLPYVGTSADGVPFDEFVHPDPAATVPSGGLPPGSSGSIPPPGDGYELGGRQFQDIDMDEVMWQPFTRPRSFGTQTTKTIPTKPIFPAVLRSDGSLPSFSALDDSTYCQLGLGAGVSGGVVITGDALVDGTSVKLIKNSGHAPVGAAGTFKEGADWELFPAQREMCQYGGNQYEPALATINASGRVAVYNTPTPIDGDGVYLLAVSNVSETSGLDVQHHPATHRNVTGINEKVLPTLDTTFPGVHVTDKLIYNLREMSPGQPAIGRSPHNGKRVFAHHGGTDTSSKGVGTPGSVVYAKNNTIFGYGGITRPVISFTNGTSQFEWMTTTNLMSPVNWSVRSTTNLGPRRGIFGARNSTVYDIGDSNFSEDDGTITLMRYAGWGFIDRMICPAQDAGGGGDLTRATINYTTLEYSEGTNPVTGEFEWVLVGSTQTTQELTFFRETYNLGNIFSFFFDRRVNNGIVNAGGKLWVQFSDKSGFTSLPPFNKFFTRAVGPRVDRLTPPAARSDVRVSIGFFPAWKLRRYVTTNNQVSVPASMGLSPASAITISFAAGLGVDTTDVNTYGPPAWDPDAGVNYIYFSTLSSAAVEIRDRVFFAKMDTSFEIFEVNRVESADAILFGRAACLSI